MTAWVSKRDRRASAVRSGGMCDEPAGRRDWTTLPLATPAVTLMTPRPDHSVPVVHSQIAVRLTRVCSSAQSACAM